MKYPNRFAVYVFFFQLFANAMVGAGLVQDPNILLTSMNDLLVKALERH